MNPISEFDNVKVDTGYDTDACVVDVDDDLASDDGKVGRADDTMSINSNITDKTTDWSCQNDVDFSNDASSTKYKEDKLGRKHIKYPRTGPVLLFNRNAQFHSQTMGTHANDFRPLLSPAVQRGRTCIVCVVDNVVVRALFVLWTTWSYVHCLCCGQWSYVHCLCCGQRGRTCIVCIVDNVVVRALFVLWTTWSYVHCLCCGQRGRTCIVCVVDNGPNMNPTNYVNEVHLGNLWFDSCADMITSTSYAAGQSAYNMIEHARSVSI